MNDFVKMVLMALGNVHSLKTLSSGTDCFKLSPGFYEFRTVNGWTYYRRGDSTIELDANDLPKDATDAMSISPEQSTWLWVPHAQRWSFLVEEGGMLQIICRIPNDVH